MSYVSLWSVHNGSEEQLEGRFAKRPYFHMQLHCAGRMQHSNVLRDLYRMVQKVSRYQLING